MARAMATRPKEVNDPGVCTTNSGTWKQQATEVKVQGVSTTTWRTMTQNDKKSTKYQPPRNYLHCSLFKCRKSRIWSRRLKKSQQKSPQMTEKQHNMTSKYIQLIQSSPSIQPFKGEARGSREP